MFSSLDNEGYVSGRNWTNPRVEGEQASIDLRTSILDANETADAAPASAIRDQVPIAHAGTTHLEVVSCGVY